MISFVLSMTTELNRIILAKTYPISDYALDFVYHLLNGSTKPLPAIDNKILLLPATELAAKIRKRQLKCKDVMKTYILRSQQVHPYINAVTDARYEDALQEAAAVDRFLESVEKSEDQIAEDTPLLGVPFSCKEVLGIKGGEAALITSAGAVIGIGTDLGGSIRIPAGFCGIYGHKPSKGIVSNWGSFPHCQMSPDKTEKMPTEKFVSTGPLCRYAADLPLLLKVLSGNDSRIKMDESVDFRKVKVYYMEEMPGMFNEARPDIKNAVIKAARHFEEEFSLKATPLLIKEVEFAIQMYKAKFTETGAPLLHKPIYLSYGKKSLNIWWELFKSFFWLSDHSFHVLLYSAMSKSGKGKNYSNLLEKYSALEKKFEDIVNEDAIFLFPMHPEPPPHRYTTIPKMRNIGYTSIFNILGYPCTVVPAGLSNGLPISIQVVSGKFRDHLTIAAAQELEKVFGGWKSPCSIEV